MSIPKALFLIAIIFVFFVLVVDTIPEPSTTLNPNTISEPIYSPKTSIVPDTIKLQIPLREYAPFENTSEYHAWYLKINRDSTLTSAQKKSLLNEYNGKYVQWDGIVKDVTETSWGGTGAIFIENPSGNWFDMFFTVDDINNKDKLLSINKGDKVVFEGKIYKTYTLRDVTVLNIIKQDEA